MKTAIFLLIIFSLVLSKANAIQLVRDTEIEDFLYNLSSCVIKSAGLNENEVKFYIVQDSSINAFVSGGQNIFVNTGTMIELKTPASLLGIIAHETGHIAAGHLFKWNEYSQSKAGTFWGATLLTAIALATGNVEMAQGIMFASMQVSQQTSLKYSRDQESSADRLAVEYLEKCSYSPAALYESMNIFYMNELGINGSMEYYTTHPLSKNRKDYIQEKISNTKNSNNELNKKFLNEFELIKAKIIGYTKSEDEVIKIYPLTDNSDKAAYARSVMYLKNNNISKSLKEANKLLKYNNPYFYELNGDIYYQAGDLEKAIKAYQKAILMIGEKPIILLSLSTSIIKAEKKELYPLAINNLKTIIDKEKSNLTAYKLLAELYYKENKIGKSYIYLAKYSLLKRDKRMTLRYIKLAKNQKLDREDTIMLNDIILEVNDLKN